MKKKIKDCTFEDIRKYIMQENKKHHSDSYNYANDKFNIKIMAYNGTGLECICGLPTNDGHSVILQGDSDKVLEQEIELADLPEARRNWKL